MNENPKNINHNHAHIARILAIQTLYAHAIQNNQQDLNLLASEILKRYKNKELFDDSNLHEVEYYQYPDEKLFNNLITTFLNSGLKQDEVIAKHLKNGWTLEKLDLLIKCILMLAVFEIQYFGDIPVKVIIDEYVTITNAFYDKKEIGFVNGILDAIAKEIRANEF